MTMMPAWRRQVHRYGPGRRRAWLFALLLGVIGASVLGIVILG
jgi:hypothetical protein